MSARIPLLNMSVGAFIARTVLVIIVMLWTLPTFGLLISSLRDKDQLSVSGWWTSLSTVQSNDTARTGTSEDQIRLDDESYVIRGEVFDEGRRDTISTFGLTTANPGEFEAGTAAEIEEGLTLTVNEDGTYEMRSTRGPIDEDRGRRFSFTSTVPPRFTLENYDEVLNSEGIGQAFINTFTVTIPATIIPIAIAAFAAYAFSWMEFPRRQFLFAAVVGLLVVPLQMSLIPLLRMYNDIANVLPFFEAKSYPGIWLAHTGFGLPLAIFLLRNYIGGLPRELIESAKIDGASHFTIFLRLVLPLSIPALASFAIFQFLWVWNDLLVALVFLTKDADQIVMTSALRELLGSRGANWEILTASAFVSIIVPLVVFFSLQRYFVRGLLAGSVKGG